MNYLLGYTAVPSVESEPTFRRKISSSSPSLFTCFHAGLSLGLFFDPEDGSDIFLRKVGVQYGTLRSVYFPFVVYVTLFIDNGSQDSVVGIATDYGLEFESR
jgi:hypothetical protein